MRNLLAPTLLLFLAASAVAQDDPMPVLGSSWQKTVRKAKDQPSQTLSPARAILPDDKYFARKARENRTDNPMDPNRESMDARSASMDRAMDEARSAKAEDTVGFQYTASMKNVTGKGVKIIYWEYRFAEIVKPENVTKRIFLCGVDLKDGESKSLTAFSLLGPSDTVDAKSLGTSQSKIFNETVEIDRIEFEDGTILQRLGWKYETVKKSVERVTAKPWGSEICKAL